MKRAAALCLALLCLTSCASMLEREYTEAAPHVEDQPPAGDAAYRVETYPALRAAILSYVEEGMESGTLRCSTTYPGNLSVDLEKARRQLMEEDPLGCYALEDIDFHTTRIIAYYEVELDFTYKVDVKELTGMPRAATQDSLSRLLAQSLENLDSRVCVYLTAYPEEDERFFADALRNAYGARPDALARPALTAELYPRSGPSRVAVLTLDYGQDAGELAGRQERLAEELDALSDTPPDAQTLFELIRGRCHLTQDGGATAYDALVEGRANGEGLTLGYAAVCRRLGLDCRAVWSGAGCYAALAAPAGTGYVDLTAGTFQLLEALPGGEGGGAA